MVTTIRVCSIIILSLSAILIYFPPITSQPTISSSMTYNCSTEYSNNGTHTVFSENLNKTLSLLHTNSSRYERGAFYYASFGEKPNTVYSLFHCSADVHPRSCRRCFNVSSELILKVCPNYKEAVFNQNDECMLKYSNNFIRHTVSPPPPAIPPPAAIPLNSTGQSPGNHISPTTIVLIVVSTVVFLAAFFTLVSQRSKIKKKLDARRKVDGGSNITKSEACHYDLLAIETATNSFSVENYIGEGGFGQVYEGTREGRRIAVKRLFRSSRQEANEFKDEVKLIAKLQHKNFVKLLGLCDEGEERILIYEFVPNKSLKSFLFESEKYGTLDWPTRYKIIQETAMGLLHLHKDSGLGVPHNNLKASNILLDRDMKPKISDFGMVRICGVDQAQGNIDVTLKTDVYDFGILLLEIISGTPSTSFTSDYARQCLQSVARKHRSDGTPLENEVTDSRLQGSFSRDEVIKCIHIGLLCIEEETNRRPTVETVVDMLFDKFTTLPMPTAPAFSLHSCNRPMSASQSRPGTVNNVTIPEPSAG